jgi:phosphoribosyl 1,2-cyclic phosphodiesterase
MSFFVKFWGTRGSIPTPGWQTKRYGGNTTCIEVRADETLFILDGGTGLRELGEDLLRRQSGAIETHMMFSHPHWDHIQGFPFFTPAYMLNNTLYIYGREDGDTSYFDLLSGQMTSEYFPVAFKDLGAKVVPAFLDPDGRVIAGVQVRWMKQVHPGGSVAYRFDYQGHSLVFSTDNELDLIIQNKKETAQNPDIPRHVSKEFLDFIQGVDLLIADGQYTDQEYESKIGWGHPRATTVVDAAIDAGVRRLVITHHDPMQSDAAVEDKIAVCRARAEARDSDLVVFAAREKVALRIDDPYLDVDSFPTTMPT